MKCAFPLPRYSGWNVRGVFAIQTDIPGFPTEDIELVQVMYI